MRQQKYLWLAVTADELELPLAVADTARELGKMCGVGKSTVENCVARGRSGRIAKHKYVKVRTDDAETDIEDKQRSV